MEYEKPTKDGVEFTWMDGEKLKDLIQPERMKQIKEEYAQRKKAAEAKNGSKLLLDILDDERGCTSCFI